MKQEVTLTKQEVNQAILDYAEKHGVRLDYMTATVEVVATRGDRELFATIAIEPKGKVTPLHKSLPEQEDEQEDEGVPVEATQEINEDIEIFE